MIWLLLSSAALVLAGRFTISGHGLSWPGTYEALAHVWVGVAGTLAWVYWGTEVGYTSLGLLLFLTAVETALFLHSVYRGDFKLWKEGP